jgi:acyl-CoA thioesterase I
VTASIFRYVALGDSTGVGVGSGHDGGYPERLYQRLKAAGVKAGILNLAESGATSADLLHGAVQKTVEVRPMLVTLGIGSNDLWRMVPLERFAANLSRIADGLEQTGATVLVSNIINLSRAPIASRVGSWLPVPLALVVQRIHQFNQVIGGLASRPRFKVLDLFTLTGGMPDFVELFSGDGFHPNGVAYERWADALLADALQAARTWSPVQDLASP